MSLTSIRSFYVDIIKKILVVLENFSLQISSVTDHSVIETYKADNFLTDLNITSPQKKLNIPQRDTINTKKK